MAQTKVLTTASSGDTTLLNKATDGPGGGAIGARQFFRVVWIAILTNGSLTVNIYDGSSATGTLKFSFPATGNTASTGVMTGAPEGGMFDSSPGNNLVLNLSAGVSATINVGYSVQG